MGGLIGGYIGGLILLGPTEKGLILLGPIGYGLIGGIIYGYGLLGLIVFIMNLPLGIGLGLMGKLGNKCLVNIGR